MSGTGTRIDVEQVVAELQERVAKARANGDQDSSIMAARFSLGSERVVLRPELATSSKRVVGVPVSALKRALIRLQFRFLDDVVGQVNSALDRERLARESEAGAREALALRVQSLEAELDAVRDGLREIERRLGDVEPRAELVDEMSSLDVLGRLARLERSGRAEADEGAIRPLLPEVAALALDRGRIDDGGTSRIGAYLAQLDIDGPILVIGLGDGGQLLKALRDAGADAVGVDANEANVAACQAQGLDVAMTDPLRHLASRGAGSLNGLVVVSGAGDRLDAEQWLVFADLVATRLRPGAGLVVEMLNVASPAGLALRMRDPTLPPPVHCDTVAFLLRVAGMEQAEVRAFGAFRDREPLPLSDDDDEPDGLDRVSRFVNQFLIGQPLAAVLARR